MAQRRGTYTATYGDLRETTTPVTDAEGHELWFPDEDSACEWAWERIQEARAPRPPMDPDQQARDKASGDEIRRRAAEFEAKLDDAVVAFTGFGRGKFPTSDQEAVLALSRTMGTALLNAAKEAARVSDTITFDEVAPFDTELRERLHQRLRVLLPYLGPTAVEALGWRWGFLNLR
ncbi:hypothetical protein ACI2IX_07435 [Leifsonia aquatica]|uniref:hypothetical protein n=1 Tax=Leifsonia aquatica TaxID=144185 RepID=UPI00384FC554